MSVPDPVKAAILEALATAPGSGGVSLARLGKRLGLEASVLLRHLALMGDAEIGGVAGPGWIRLEQLEDRWIVHLLPAGRRASRFAAD